MTHPYLSAPAKSLLKVMRSCHFSPLICLLLAIGSPYSAFLSAQVNYAVGPDGRYAYVTNSPSCTGVINISETFGTLPVTSIGHSAFKGCSGLTKIVIPFGVTNVGDSSFYLCSGLTDVAFGDGPLIHTQSRLTQIGSQAFYGCRRLTNIAIPKGVTNIGDWAFTLCSRLTNITIPDSLTTIGVGAFFGCDGLTSVTIPSGLTKIQWQSFASCNGLTRIAIPANIIEIGTAAFSQCFNLTNVTISSGVRNIDNEAFDRCSSLTGITIPNSVNRIGDWAFSGCVRLNLIMIPNSITNIGYGAFAGCAGLTNIDVETPGNRFYKSVDGVLFKDRGSLLLYPPGRAGPYIISDGVTSIDRSAFSKSLVTRITIPNSVTYIGNGAFSDCPKLERIDVGLTNINYSSVDGILHDRNAHTLVQCPGRRSGALSIQNSVTNIGNDSFFGCSALTSIEIPNGVTIIGSGAFRECRSLRSIKIPDGVIRIGSHAFAGCSALTSLAIPNGVTSIEANAFLSCDGLTAIAIPSSVTKIGLGAFSGCIGLGSITIPDSVTSIEGYAFSGCYGLTRMIIPNRVTSIGPGAFDRCWGLLNVTMPASVASMGQMAFAECSSLTSIIIIGDEPRPVWSEQLFSTTSPRAMVYYLPNTERWRSTFGGRPTRMLSLPQCTPVGFGSLAADAPFALRVNGAAIGRVVLEATTDFTTWQPVSTNTLNGASLLLIDPRSAQFKNRFYRIRVPWP